MKGFLRVIVRLIRAVEKAYARKWSFLGLFAVAFLGSVALLASLDLLPQASTPESTHTSIKAPKTVLPTVMIESPTKIEIAKIGLMATISNPITTEVKALDAELLKGAVHYPTSAKLGENGNVVLFGHSSYLPIVKNPAYKTFNNIQKLIVGDTVTVYSSTTAYTYRVRSVTKESAESGAIPLSVTGKVLTLSTCDSFGAKTDRFVVVADFVESHSLGA